MTTTKPFTAANRILASLPNRIRQQCLDSCELVELKYAQAVCKAGDTTRHVYFPIDSFISLITTLPDKSRLEVGMIGNEGMLGTSLALGVARASQHGLVQGAGRALRMSAVTFNGHLRRHPLLRQTLLRYVDVLMSQLALTAACSHYHLVEARLARWLLMTRDCAHSNRFHITHEFLAYMLGVRRVGVTQAAGALQARGLIRYARGEIEILDGRGLERASCLCYRQGTRIYAQWLGARRKRSEHR